MATDIAFALGALALLGSAVPIGLKVFLTALAIVDDIASVLVIALFYSGDVDQLALLAAAVILGALIVANALGIRRPVVYGILGILLWLAFVQSGIHATIAGVLLAMTIPVRARIDATEFLRRGRHLLDAFDAGGSSGHDVLTTPDQRAALLTLETACNQVETPLHRMEHALHPWVTFLILPVFALANAGVRFQGNVGAALTQPVAIGVLLGLIVGKQLGITSFAYLAVRSGVATLPTGVTWRHIYGAAWLGGIGFTMSLFIAMLAFNDPILLGVAKFAIIIASVIAGVGGVLVLRGATRPETAGAA
jgi:NhaA family Na+:H+ antiporter